ncbi:MAG TPA: patatin-like phospholipase family protein [Hyalangium sp.]|nr:patatin-like phospholipase family protein [Hyalangium sp.]
MNRKILCLWVPLALLTQSCFARTDYVLKMLNKPSDEKPEEVHRPPPSERVARLTRSQLVDAYLDPKNVTRWMSSLGSTPDVLIAHTTCLAQTAGGDNSECYKAFMASAVRAPLWGVPTAPSSVNLEDPAPEEIDAARFLANALSIGPSLVVLQQALGREITEEELRTGIQLGAEYAAQYIHARRWHRTLRRPTNALVMSGGAANGAFTAGVIWRLLGVLHQCRGKAGPQGCGDARIDLVAGTSTGALIGTLVDLFHTPGHAEKARNLLVQNYTCSVESDLYCVNSTWIWNLADDVTGLVRFDGIDRKLRQAVIPEMMDNGTELVSVSVDYNSGDVFGISDQDPTDLPPGVADRTEGLIQGITASIVEPFLAEPVKAVPAKGGTTQGTFLDGGVRSGLPLLQAVQRGAERVLVISTGGIDASPSPESKSKNAFGILMRTLDLFVAQPRVGEVQQAEMMAVTRRFAEYNVCMSRLEGISATDAKPYCSRSGRGFEPPAEAQLRAVSQTSLWMGPARFEEVASSWRTARMYRPDGLETASGYAFTPKVMRPLFLHGVETFQQRCQELLKLFSITGTIARGQCDRAPEEVKAEAEQAFGPTIEQCTQDKPEQRKCP